MLHEWLASMMQRRYGKSTPENDDRYLRALLHYIPAEALFGNAADFDPLRQLSPLETIDTSALEAASAPPEGVRANWQEGVTSRLLGSHKGVHAHPVVVQFLQSAGRLLALVLPPESAAAAAAQSAIKSSTKTEKGAPPLQPDLKEGPAAALDACWPAWRHAALESLLLRMRKARYTCKVEEQQPEAPAAAAAAAEEAGDAAMDDEPTADPIAPSMVAPLAAPATDAAAAAEDAPAAPAVKVVSWEPAPPVSCLGLVVSRLQQSLAPQLRSYKQARLDAARLELLAATVKLLKEHDADTEKACAALKDLQLHMGPTDNPAPAGAATAPPTPCATLLGHTFSLQRKDVPDVLGQLGATCSMSQEGKQPAPAAGDADAKDDKDDDTEDAPAQAAAAAAADLVLSAGDVTPNMLHVLVSGEWCSQGAQVLRRSVLVQQLCISFGSSCDDLLKAIKAQEVCLRTVRPNRHGHNKDMPYPGPAGWSTEYAAARLAGVVGRRAHKRKKVQKGLEEMRRFTAMANWARATAAGSPGQLAAVEAVLAAEVDAHKYNAVLGQVKDILQQDMPADMLLA